jgi:uncharacterized protein YkwD
MSRSKTSMKRKVLLGGLTAACIFASQIPSNVAEACPPRPTLRILVTIPLPAQMRWPIPAHLPAPPAPPSSWVAPGAERPASPPGDGWPAAWSSFEDQVLVLTNERRARGAVCGDRTFPPAPPLAMSPILRRAAREHSADMGTRRYFSHTTPDGRSYVDRLRAAGSTAGFSGENIFTGPPTPADVVDGWMKSPGHCDNIMAAGFRYIGVGYADIPGSPGGKYWTEDFGDTG